MNRTVLLYSSLTNAAVYRQSLKSHFTSLTWKLYRIDSVRTRKARVHVSAAATIKIVKSNSSFMFSFESISWRRLSDLERLRNLVSARMFCTEGRIDSQNEQSSPGCIIISMSLLLCLRSQALHTHLWQSNRHNAAGWYLHSCSTCWTFVTKHVIMKGAER